MEKRDAHATSREPAIASRGSRASQSETAISPSEPASGGTLRWLTTSRPACSSHCATVSSRKAEPAMGMLLAQELELVRGEIDHQQPALRTQHARGLADRACAVVEIVQDLMHDHEVEGIARQREVVDVALAHAAMAQPGAVEARARQRQHVE